MARFYDAAMSKMEQACFSEWRSDLLSEIHGDVLEIGSGTGVNLPHYPGSINSLVLTEPEPHMLTLLRNNIDKSHKFPDSSFDSVVSTLVLCSVASPEATLCEIKRVLKPGGRLYFIEHVCAQETPGLIRWQKFLQPLWKRTCGNCHLTRDTEMNISRAGFTFDRIERLDSFGGPAIVSPTIKGIASNT